MRGCRLCWGGVTSVVVSQYARLSRTQHEACLRVLAFCPVVLRLRNSLEPGRNGSSGVLTTEGTGYRLVTAPDSVDAELFAAGRLRSFGARRGPAGGGGGRRCPWATGSI